MQNILSKPIMISARARSKMANLVYYRNERELYKVAFEKKMSIDEAEIVFKKLVRHYKLGIVKLNWTSGNRNPKAFNGFYKRVLLNTDDNSFGVLCHELAHIKEYKKFNKGGHNKKHWRFMKSIIIYCERKSWFEAELNKRLAVKPAKPEPTKDEIRMKLVIHLQKNCKKYQTKIKMYSNKLKKAQKKIKRMGIGIVMGNPNAPILLRGE